MLFEVGEIVKGYLEPLSFIDKRAGLVKTLSKSDVTEKGLRITKSFPVACNVNYEDCIKSGNYTDLVPNNKIGCMIYLEDNGGMQPLGQNGANFVFKANYRLVGWVNNKKLGYEDCSITGQIILSIFAVLPKIPRNEGNYQRLLVELGGQDPKSYVPFAKYSYDEDKTQYLMYPYDYFSLPLSVTFQMNPACVDAFIKQTAINCKN